MPDTLTEALLEMHYHHAIKGFFQKTYGATFLRLLKPSQRRETWVGFDQGWVRIKVEAHEFYDQLQRAIQSRASTVDRFYLGFFLQFKRVNMITQPGKYMPAWYRPPYYRSELSVKRSRTTGLSQHETLLRLCHINSASVCYACPMLFESDELYESADLAGLRCIDVATAPPGWTGTQRHFLTFQDPDDQVGLWHSEPIRAPVLGFHEWAAPDRKDGVRKLSALETLRLIEDVGDEIRTESYAAPRTLPERYPPWPLYFVPTSLTILEFSTSAEEIASD